MPDTTHTRQHRSPSWRAVRLWRAIPLLAATALIVAAFLSYGVAHGSEVGAGRIAFSAYRHHNWDIYTVNPDGSDLRRVTHDPAPDRSPAWSPDGTQIAFASRRDHNWDIYVVDANGGEPRRLTAHPAYDGAP
ncbi:MAG: hypothetical protein GTN71_22110, partial [Anaerolineae bacterium]|nr:hypothetical protein [Anaerolineae bacterium]